MHDSNAELGDYYPACGSRFVVPLKAGQLARLEMEELQMKWMILAAFAVLSLSTGAAYAQGVPAGFQGYVYGSKSFTGPSANSGQAAGTASSAKGG